MRRPRRTGGQVQEDGAGGQEVERTRGQEGRSGGEVRRSGGTGAIRLQRDNKSQGEKVRW